MDWTSAAKVVLIPMALALFIVFVLLAYVDWFVLDEDQEEDDEP